MGFFGNIGQAKAVKYTKFLEVLNWMRSTKKEDFGFVSYFNGSSTGPSVLRPFDTYAVQVRDLSTGQHRDYNEEEFFENGKDEVEFFIRTNLGEDEKPLSKIASGGEMSRIMLAIKKVLADTDKMPVLIFDEIDTGISGKAANAVAEKLNGISKNHQVLCISHLPSIAAIADYNYFISKKVVADRTNTNIKLLNEKETLEEIARISSGEINETTINYAMQLRNKKAC